MKFLHKVASLPKLTRAGLISAFTFSHVAYDRMFAKESQNTILIEEQTQKISNMALAPDLTQTGKSKAPSIEDLLGESSIISGL